MSRISSETLPASSYPMPGRLVPLQGFFDKGDRTLEFAVPSQSEQKTYIVWVDCISTEVVCDCEWFVGKMKTLHGLRSWGTSLEHLAYLDHHRILPSILRKDAGMCYHCRRVKAWLKSHKIYPHLQEIAGIHEQRLMNKRTA